MLTIGKIFTENFFMKVLLLPANIASEISNKVSALREIGVDAHGLAFGNSPLQTGENVKIIGHVAGKKDYLRVLKAAKYLYDSISKADVLHWVGAFNSLSFSVEKFGLNVKQLDKKILQRFDKPGVVQWVGSDIRNPEIDFKLNPFYKSAFTNGYEYSDYESRQTSLANQKEFAEMNFFPLEFVGTEHYIDRKLFPKRFRVWQTVVLAEHTPKFPDTDKRKPLIVHSPSAPVAKGTKYVLEAVEKLKTSYDFEFRLVENVERRRALEIVREADVFVDQLILGAHGVASVEAMAFGKPVLCYINPEIGKNYPAELPIINASPENVVEKLEMLLKNPGLRNETGKKSREYVEKYHDDRKMARELVEIYREVIELHKQRSDG